jgi:kynurenine formamidase
MAQPNCPETLAVLPSLRASPRSLATRRRQGSMTRPENRGPAALDASGFGALYQRLQHASGWGAADRRGALNHLTQARVLAAVSEVRLGRTVTLAAPIESRVSLDNPEPAVHQMISPAGDQADPEGLSFAMDRLAMNVHGDADSHIDALCHVIYRARLYNGVAADTVTAAGPLDLSIEVARDGIAGRGVLLDIPRLRGVPWLEPGEPVTAEDLTGAEEAQHVRVGQGDLLFVRVGHRQRRNELGPWDAAHARAGLHPAALEFVAERRVAVLGSDGNNDTSPSAAEGVDFPVHVLAVNAMGLHLLDYLQLDDVAPLCEEAGRWSFFCVIAPLRLARGTGSPVNPIAIL